MVVEHKLSKIIDKSIQDPSELEAWEKTGWKNIISNSKPELKLRLPWSHMEERLRHNLLTKAKQLTMSVIIIVGSDDSLCPVEHQRMLFNEIPSKIKKLAIVQGAPHSFRKDEDIKQLCLELNNWLKS